MITVATQGYRSLAVLAGVLFTLVLAAGPANAALKIHQTVRTEQMDQENDGVVAGCSKGEEPISGGFTVPEPGPSLFNATASFLSEDGWQASAQHRLGDLSDGFITSFAYCSTLGKKVESRGETSDLDAGSSTNLTASCKRSETLISGGWALVGSGQGLVLQSQKTGKRSWTIFGRATLGSVTLVVLANCVPSKGAPELVTRTSTDPTSKGTMFASCKGNEQVVSGGVNTNTTFVPFEFHRASKRKWGVAGDTFGDPGQVKTFAYCEKTG